MSGHNHIHMWACLLVLAGCSADSESRSSIPERTAKGGLDEFSGVVPESPDQIPEPVNLQSHAIIAEYVEWGYPAIIQPIGNRLLVGDPNWSPRFAVVDLERDSLAYRFGRDGEGPREFRSPTWVLVESEAQQHVWIFDSETRRFTLVDLDAPEEPQFLDHVFFNPNENVRQPVFTDSGFISNGVFADFTLIVTDRQSNELDRITVTPPYSWDDVPDPGGVRMLNTNRLAIRPTTNELAVLYVHSPRIDFFAPAGEHRGTVVGPRTIDTRYAFVAERFRWDPDDERAFLNTYGTARYLYAFFCGCTRLERREGKVPSVIQIFNWNGDFVSEVALDRPILGFAVSANDSALYAGVGDPEPALVVWQLPDWLRGGM